MADNTFDVKGGSNQILPNAKEGNQYFIGDSAIKIAQQAKSNALDGQLVDMTYFSGTFPEMVEHELWREIHLSVVCLTGEEGVGMTTFLSQFARKHGNNCVSYFYNSFDRIQLESEVMEGDITEQLYWFANKCNCPSGIKHVNDIYTKVLRQLKQSKDGIMYFVFDGFNDLPSEHKENICKLIEKLQWEKAHFLLSGSKEQIEGLFKQSRKWSISEVPLLRFSEADTNEYFSRANPILTKEQLFELYKISRGNASRMNNLRTKFLCNGRIEDLMNADIDANSDLNQEDYERICEDSDPAVIPLFALLTYAEFEFDVDFAAQVLEIVTEDVKAMADNYSDYILIKDNGIISLRTVVFRKYLYERLQGHKRDVELRQIRVLESMKVGEGYAMALPSLYRSAGLNDVICSTPGSHTVPSSSSAITLFSGSVIVKPFCWLKNCVPLTLQSLSMRQTNSPSTTAMTR